MVTVAFFKPEVKILQKYHKAIPLIQTKVIDVFIGWPR